MSQGVLSVCVERPWLTVEVQPGFRALSFAPYRSGDVTCDRIAWREVRDDDLTPGFDALAWLADEVSHESSVAMLTSRNVEKYIRRQVVTCDVRAEVIATVGLSNAERVGVRRTQSTRVGTINIAVVVSVGLTMSARMEAMSIAASARTAAVLDAEIALESGLATGTGTDCIVVASPEGPVEFAGMHTDVGEAVGGAVYGAVSVGVSSWLAER